MPLAPDTRQALYSPNYDDMIIIFQWDEPFASASPGSTGSRSDLDVFFYDSAGMELLDFSADANIEGDPIEVISLNVTSFLESLGRENDPGYIFLIEIGLLAGPPPTRMKRRCSKKEALYFLRPNSGSSYGHSVAAGSVAVAAAYAGATPPFGIDPALVETDS